MHSTVVQRRVIVNIEIVCCATVKVDVDQNCAALGIGYIGLRDCVVTTLSGVDLPKQKRARIGHFNSMVRIVAFRFNLAADNDQL